MSPPECACTYLHLNGIKGSWIPDLKEIRNLRACVKRDQLCLAFHYLYIVQLALLSSSSYSLLLSQKGAAQRLVWPLLLLVTAADQKQHWEREESLDNDNWPLSTQIVQTPAPPHWAVIVFWMSQYKQKKTCNMQCEEKNGQIYVLLKKKWKPLLVKFPPFFLIHDQYQESIKKLSTGHEAHTVFRMHIISYRHLPETYLFISKSSNMMSNIYIFISFFCFIFSILDCYLSSVIFGLSYFFSFLSPFNHIEYRDQSRISGQRGGTILVFGGLVCGLVYVVYRHIFKVGTQGPETDASDLSSDRGMIKYNDDGCGFLCWICHLFPTKLFQS